jgi:pyruvate dehydrogenase E2 component (dihydrolipoamide acetyltransferase)
MATPVVLPPIHTDTTEGTVARWLVAVGQGVAAGDVLAEVDTAKALVELEAPCAGLVLALLAGEGQDVLVGDTLAWIGEAGEAVPESEPATTGDAGPIAPPVRRLAERLGVDPSTVPGTGPRGRVLLVDVETAAAAAPAAVVPQASRMRRALAEAMSRSWREVPHFSCQIGADLSRRSADAERHGWNIVILAAVARTLGGDSVLNATYDDARGRVPGEGVHLAFAVGLEDGLAVPVIRDADRLSPQALHSAADALAHAARAGRLRPRDTEGHTFTVSNLGMTGVDSVVPIVHRPAVAILGVGAVRAGRVVLTLSCDHRAVDGLQASRWLAALAATLAEGESESA